MADTQVVNSGENTPEYVAYRLLRDIALAESKQLYGIGGSKPSREWILDTYAESLQAVKDSYNRLQESKKR